jgi:hypothetical protein
MIRRLYVWFLRQMLHDAIADERHAHAKANKLMEKIYEIERGER